MTDRLPSVLSFETIFTLAERESGAYGLADDGLRERIAALIDWINQHGPYTIDQVDAMSRQLRKLLVNRLRLALDRTLFPGIATEEIDRPIFVVGFPRSGTTLLHSLLAEDPEVQTPRSWHTLAGSPPPGAGPVASGRIALAQRAVEEWLDYCPTMLVMHPYGDKGAYQLIEDEELFAFDFRGARPLHLYKIPTLDVVMTTVESDQVAAFRFHREFLQHLQWNTGQTRWVCKGPSSQFHLDALFAVYPDALCVWPHRPIGEMYASDVSLRAVVYDTVSGKPNDWTSQAPVFAERMKAAVDRLIHNELIDDPRIMHMSYRDLSADPIGTIGAIYERRGWIMSADYEIRIRAWLDDPENRVDRYGRYPYSTEAFGLDRLWIEQLFADYSKRFGLADAP